MLEVDAGAGWWDSLPDEIRADAEAALAEFEKGDVIPQTEIQKQLFPNGLAVKLNSFSEI